VSEQIEVVPYDPRWADAFGVERTRLAAALGALARRIDHHGSTAVRGLAAKPIIDIQISVDCLQPMVPYAQPLARLGYVHVPHADDAFCPFFHRPASWPHTHHIHVVRWRGDEERRTLAFRDYLRDHAHAAAEYETLKRRLVTELRGVTEADREAYAAAKTEFVGRIVRIAVTEGYPRDGGSTILRPHGG